MYKAKLEVTVRQDNVGDGGKWESRLTAKFDFSPETTPQARKHVKKRILGFDPQRAIGTLSQEYFDKIEDLYWDNEKKCYVREGAAGATVLVKARPHRTGLGLTVTAEMPGQHAIDDILNLDTLDYFVRRGEYNMQMRRDAEIGAKGGE